jgi:hypothetical protein
LIGLCLAVLATVPGQVRESTFVFPPQRQGEVTATLALRVPEQGPAPGRGRARLTLSVSGPASVQVDEPRLEDALAGWRTEWAVSSWSTADGKAGWEQTLELVQVKPGMVPLPGVTLRFRTTPEASWQEFTWPDLLNEPRDVPDPEQLPPLPPSPWPGRLRLAGIVLATTVGLALLVRAGRRWRAAGTRPVPVHERALMRLTELPAEPAAAVFQIDGALRDYLEERFGVAAKRRTNREVLAALVENKTLPAEQTTVLAELLDWLDRAKFAGEDTTGGLREAAQRASQLVRETAPREEAKEGEGGKAGEKETHAEGG